jgi:hypothetical protein
VTSTEKILRGLVLVLGTLHAVLCLIAFGLWIEAKSRSDYFGGAIELAVLILVGIPFIICSLPAVILAWKQRLLPLALLLVVLSIPVAWLIAGQL